MSEASLNLRKTREIPRPTYYVQALQGEFSEFAYDEERALAMKGAWREKAFIQPQAAPLDLEIGTGNGYFFAHQAEAQPQRLLLGLEIKFKPLIQTIRRALFRGCKNARVARFHAGLLDLIFADQELDNVYVHHPDPWTKRRRHKHRLLSSEFLMQLRLKQKPGAFIDFKTDSRDYFFWAVEQFKNTPYFVERYSEDLHNSEWCSENFVTHFEKIYATKGQPIYYLRAINSTN